MSQMAEITDGRREGGSTLESADGFSPEALFLQPAAGRILTGVGLAGGHLPQILRHHGSAARRIVTGRQILKIVEKIRRPD